MNKQTIRNLVLATILAGTMVFMAGCGAKEEKKDTSNETNQTNSSQSTKEINNGTGLQKCSYGSLKDFTASTINGDSFTQEDLKKADLTVVYFWQTTCNPCIGELPNIVAFSKAIPSNVQVINICADGTNNTDQAKRILADSGFTGTTLVGKGSGDYQGVMSKLRYTPTTFIVDSEGNIVGEVSRAYKGDPVVEYMEALDQAFTQTGKTKK